MMGPACPFASFPMPQSGQAIWLVGRADTCALGHAPVGEEGLGFISPPPVRLSVSLYVRPRIVELELPKIVQPITNPCDPSAPLVESPLPTP